MIDDKLKELVKDFCHKKKYEIITLIVEQGLEGYNWHKSLKFYLYYIQNGNKYEIMFRIKDIPTGCGICVLYEFSDRRAREETKEILDLVLQYYRNNQGCGTFIATHGTHHISEDNNLENWGFTPLSTYYNKQHGDSNHWQTLYEYIVDKENNKK